MGAFLKLIDIILFLFFIIIAINVPLLNTQLVFPREIYPDILVNVKDWYIRQYGDYLFSAKPSFFIGLIWLEILFQWPLCVFNLFGILGSKSWYPTTCLMYGVSAFTSTVAILSELIGSGKASDELIMIIYAPFLGMGILATLRGLFPHSANTVSPIRTKPAVARKKRA